MRITMMEEDSIVNFSFEASFPSKNSWRAFENRGSKPVNHRSFLAEIFFQPFSES